MRSVFVFFKSASKPEIREFFDAHFSRQQEDHWIFHEALYIGFYEDAQREFEPDEFAALQTYLRRPDVFAAVADVSGSIPGDTEAKFFCEQLLSRFSGVAMDDYSSHLWTLDEIRSGHRHQGHTFFDSQGWFDEGDAMRALH